VILGQSVSTLQYIRIAVHATVNGNASYNPTGDTVQFGFQNQATTSSSTAPSAWVAALWETDVVSGQTVYVAKCLVGPGGTFVPTANSNWWLWIFVQDSPEQPKIFVGELRIT
jgi:hypothetical protein